ncbi:hypothetical protein O7627_04665 [Solwaraspora sp. WMMD1047]|uniref:hypothetical protein n=1 Tax=Solwaraspora sp. WMMD1047 TaxID=3016102 RepID=UPI002417B1E2|nr:hypothetical protein [Solwaraspora sp. WMMD1047]MDG4828597.1 hypothetical protein [Solwaraspora sp. WMMD1047]
MQRVRRLASIAVIAALGATALSGCRSEPGVAAYIGDTKITEERVTAIIDEIRAVREAEAAEAPAGEQSPGAEQPPVDPQQPAGEVTLPERTEVVTMLLLNELCERLAADRGWQPQQQITPDQVAERFGIPADSGWAREQARSYTCFPSLPTPQPVVPTAEELAEVIERGREAGFVPPEVSDADAAARLDGEQLRTALGQRDLFAEAFAAYDVTVNPRYRPLEYPVLKFQASTLVSLTIGEADSDTVVDAR